MRPYISPIVEQREGTDFKLHHSECHSYGELRIGLINILSKS